MTDTATVADSPTEETPAPDNAEQTVGASPFTVHQHMRMEAVSHVFEGFGEAVKHFGNDAIADYVRRRIEAAEHLTHYLLTGNKPAAPTRQ